MSVSAPLFLHFGPSNSSNRHIVTQTKTGLYSPVHEHKQSLQRALLFMLIILLLWLHPVTEQHPTCVVANISPCFWATALILYSRMTHAIFASQSGWLLLQWRRITQEFDLMTLVLRTQRLFSDDRTKVSLWYIKRWVMSWEESRDVCFKLGTSFLKEDTLDVNISSSKYTIYWNLLQLNFKFHNFLYYQCQVLIIIFDWKRWEITMIKSEDR